MNICKIKIFWKLLTRIPFLPTWNSLYNFRISIFLPTWNNLSWNDCSYVKLFVSLFLSCIFHFCCKNQRNVLQKEVKDRTFETYLLIEEPSFWFLLIESLKMICARSFASFLNFLSNGEGIDCFLWHILPKPSKITEDNLIW